mgnify:CR=1 FL=1
MIKERTTKQKTLILSAVQGTKTHPTAEQVYDLIRGELPNVSLGTVYRNLTVLEQEGIIRKIPVGDGHEHFDGDNSQHSHFYCKSCERITDIVIDTTDACSLVEKETGAEVESGTYTFTGICKNCK